MSSRPCLRCELEQEFFSPEQIAALATEIRIDPSLAADEEIYKNRLAACKTCEALRDEVLCVHCGCFVLIRARPAAHYCPHPAGDRWIKSK